MNNIAIMVSDTKYNNIITKTVEYFTKSEKALVTTVVCGSGNDELRIGLRRYRTDVYYTDWYKDIDVIFTESGVDCVLVFGWHEALPPNFRKKYDGKLIGLVEDIDVSAEDGSLLSGINIVKIHHSDGVVLFSKHSLSNGDSWHVIGTMLEKYYCGVIDNFVNLS